MAVPQSRKNKNKTAEVVARQIEKHYRELILSGALLPRGRLPTNRALAAEWGTSCNTVQKALANLTAAGLIERSTARGTFVRGPQNRAHVGILVGPSLTANTSWFYRNLVEALQNELETEHLACRVYSGLSFREESVLKAVRLDERYLSFIGSIEIATARCSDPLQFGNTPKVVFEPQKPENCLQFDWADCCKRITLSLKEQKVGSAWIVYRKPKLFPVLVGHLLAEALAKDHPIPSQVKEVPYEMPGPAIDQTGYQFWMNHFSGGGIRDLPEAIVVADDTLLSSLLYALLKYGIDVPRQTKIFVVTTQKEELFSPVPIARFVFPVDKMARIVADQLRKRICGEKPPAEPIALKGEFLTNY